MYKKCILLLQSQDLITGDKVTTESRGTSGIHQQSPLFLKKEKKIGPVCGDYWWLVEDWGCFVIFWGTFSTWGERYYFRMEVRWLYGACEVRICTCEVTLDMVEGTPHHTLESDLTCMLGEYAHARWECPRQPPSETIFTCLYSFVTVGRKWENEIGKRRALKCLLAVWTWNIYRSTIVTACTRLLLLSEWFTSITGSSSFCANSVQTS